MSGPESTQLLEVGRITKPHGLRGDLLVVLTTSRDERVAAGAVLFADDDTLIVESSRPHQDRFIVKFAEVNSREDADELRGRLLYAEAIDDPDEIWVHELIGCTVTTIDGTNRGVVESVEQNPASDLLVTSAGGFIPARFIVEFVPGTSIVVDVPEGLFDQ